MPNDLMDTIQEQYAGFSKGQKAIADYILQHYDKAAFMTAARLGQTVGVSESTVVRFVVELGFEGYPELKKELQRLIRNKLTSLQRMQVTEDKVRDSGVLRSVLTSDMLNISETLQQLDPAAFDQAVEKLLEARNIYIIGFRSAGTLASFLSYNLNLAFDNIRQVDANGASEMFEQILRVDEKDVVIGISFPRYSKRTVRALNFASDRGATVIALTDSITSPLAPYASILLIAQSDMASYVDSLVAPMSLINALIVGVTLKKRNEVEQVFLELEQIWEEYKVYDKNNVDSAKEDQTLY